MKSIQFTSVIDADCARVWDVMLSDATYRKWAAEFMEGSYFEGSWEKGKRIRFLGPGGAGMTAVIAENRPREFVSIKHLGLVNDFVDDIESAEAKNWAPAYENYTFNVSENTTKVTVDLEVPEEFESYMQESWPKALAKLKELCEAR
jgi:uncharacterized protein YndB with AHSA1/START domain